MPKSKWDKLLSRSLSLSDFCIMMSNIILAQHEKLVYESNYAVWHDRMLDSLGDDDVNDVASKITTPPAPNDVAVVEVRSKNNMHKFLLISK